MIRTFLAIALIAAAPTAAHAQAASSRAFSGVVVEGQPRDAYVIHLDVTNKAEAEARRMIWDASHTVCVRAPRTGNTRDFNVSYFRTCENAASRDGFQQLGVILKARAEQPNILLARAALPYILIASR